MLRLNEIHTYYGNIRAIRGVSLYVEAGENGLSDWSEWSGQINDANDDIGYPSPRRKVQLPSRGKI